MGKLLLYALPMPGNRGYILWCIVLRLVAVALSAGIVCAGSVFAAPGGTGASRILMEKCAGCHGQARMSGLDLRTREGLLTGGGRGPAVKPGDAAGSLLYQAVAGETEFRMPPGKNALAPEEVAAIREWIDAGAHLAGDAPVAETSWWSFQKPVRAKDKPLSKQPARWTVARSSDGPLTICGGCRPIRQMWKRM